MWFQSSEAARRPHSHGSEHDARPPAGRGGSLAPRARALLALALSLAAAACEIAEVATPQGEDLLVVEAVLRAGDDRQLVLLHRALEGDVVRGEPGARVSVRGPAGDAVPLREVGLDACAEHLFPERTDSLAVQASCYAAGREQGLDVVPGAEYELRVDTRDGARLRGRTRVPGPFRLRSPTPPERGVLVCSLPASAPLEVAWTQAPGAWSYLIAAEINGLRAPLQQLGIRAPDRLELTGLAISERDTTITIPAELGVFERADVGQEILRALQGGFPAGISVRLVVAAADRNFVNAVRGGGFNPSGNTRISSVVGDGVGVFGALVPLDLLIYVGSDTPYPPCAGR